jgi:hypothetical protein
MSRKIIGVTVGTQLPKPNFDQTDPTKGDYIRGNRSFLTMDETLTQSGRPADAKATGDAINLVQADVDIKLSGKSDISHSHDSSYDVIGSAETAIATSKEYTDNKVASMIFIGTREEYNAANANGQILINTFVIITDDESSSDSGDPTSPTTSMLGYAVLGQMVLE